MRSKLAAIVTVAVTAVVAMVGVGTQRARAASGAYDPNLIISNQTFDAVGSMTAAQIQTFLDRYPNSCLRNYSAPVPTGYSTYGAKGKASAVIRAAATLWGVNPQVLLVTLEKEQSIVTGGGGCDAWRYWSAMGYNCPDGGGRYNYPNLGITGTCVKREADAGFSAQVNHGAWQLQFNRQRAEGNLNWNGSSSVVNYGYNTPGYRQAYAGAPTIYYDGWASIGGQQIFMTNGATATLYTYTPHVSANKAFYDLFTNWFGSSTAPTTTRPPTTTTTTTIPAATLAANAAYADSVYRVFLGRRATTGEQTLWATFLSTGGSRSGFLGYVVTTTEYAGNRVSAAYRTLLHREADSGGLKSWTDVLVKSSRDDRLDAGLAGSAEYFEQRADNDTVLFLTALYGDLLGRNVDVGGLESWSAQLANGKMNRTQVATAVLASPEYARRAVAISYAYTLGRWPDDAGWDYWAGVYQKTHRSSDVGSALATSAEGVAYLTALQ